MARTSECDLFGTNETCPLLIEERSEVSEDANLGPNIEIITRGSLLDSTVSLPTATSPPKFGDTAEFKCRGIIGPPQKGPNVVTCGLEGQWEPDPRTTSTDPTLCTAQYCADADLPPASTAKVLTPFNRRGELLYDLQSKEAPLQVQYQCDPSARMLVEGIDKGVGFVITASCELQNLSHWFMRKDNSSSANSKVNFDQITCQCGAGSKQGEGDQVAECIPCLDGTYAPLNADLERAECRACPREGVHCNDGKLTILKDYWYDAERAARPNEDGESGLGPTTQLYRCAMRNACLLNKTVAPMTVRCHENHTGVMCARCYSRHVDCGRVDGAGGGQNSECAPPQYYDRGEEWMYFAPIARHCMRCPAGREAVSAYIITIVLAIVFAAALVIFVVHRLMSAWKRVKGRKRSDASGIMRVFFNWIQCVSMLQSIKLQPPEEVTNAMETAEVANVSIEWFPIQCTLRLSFYTRVLVYALMPIFAVLIPLIYVFVMNKCTPLLRKQVNKKRALKRTGRKLSPLARVCFCFVDIISGEDVVKKASEKMARSQRAAQLKGQGDVDSLYLEIDVLIDELEAAEAEIVALKREGVDAEDDGAEDEDGVEDEDSAEGGAAGEDGTEEDGAAVDGNASATREAPFSAPLSLLFPLPTLMEGAEDLAMDDLGGAEVEDAFRDDLALPSPLQPQSSTFFKVVSTRPLSLRASPSRNAEKLPWVVQHGDVVSSSLMKVARDGDRRTRFLKIIVPDDDGPSEGWLFDTLLDGTELLREVDARTMVDPRADAVESSVRDELRHCYLAIVNMTPSVAREGAVDEFPGQIARESIEYVLPASQTQIESEAFFAEFDQDNDGSIDFSEFVTMYPVLRKEWRFEEVWAEFRHIDTSGDGMLQMEELRTLVPQGSSQAEMAEWMKRFDSGEKGFISLSDFVAIDDAVQRDTLWLAVGTAFVLCTYFIYSRVTKALLSVFSMDKIEGQLYLKREVGTKALTNDHWAMMSFAALYILLFSAVVPLLGLWMMYQVRHQQGERRVGTMAGFLMDGYKEEVAWFWEFIVLARKLIILSVSLFIWEPFIQSFVAVIVLIVSLSIQLYWRPFELLALNLLELASLASLLTTQLCGVLMWYKQQPGKTDNAELYQKGSVFLLFATNGCVIASFVGVIAWYYFKQKSKLIVQWMPCTLSCLDAVVEAEEHVRWPSGSSLSREVELDMRDEWSYHLAQREGRLFGRGAAHSARKKVSKMVATVEDLVDRTLLAEEKEPEKEPESGADVAMEAGRQLPPARRSPVPLHAREGGVQTSTQRINPFLASQQGEAVEL